MIRRLREGRADAATEFSQRLRCVARFVALNNVRHGKPLDEHELADVAQSALTSIWQRIDRFNGTCALETWVYRFCEFEFLNALKRLRKRPNHESLEGTAIPAPHHVSLVEFDFLHRCLSRLDPKEAEIIRAKIFDDLTFEQIASRQGMSADTIKSRYYRGFQKLKRCVEPYITGETP